MSDTNPTKSELQQWHKNASEFNRVLSQELAHTQAAARKMQNALDEIYQLTQADLDSKPKEIQIVYRRIAHIISGARDFAVWPLR